MLKNILRLLPICLLVLSCNSDQNDFKTDIAVPVTVEEVGVGFIEQTYTATGSIVPEFDVLFKSEMDGKYHLQINPRTGKLYKMGDKVRKGDLIIKIEDAEYENNINIKGSEIDLEISKMENDKQKALYEKGGVTLREKVNGEKELVTAQKNYENALLNLAKMKLLAPFDGVITNLPYYSPDAKIDAGVELLQLMSFSKMIMDIMLPENQFAYVSLNQSANIMNYALPNDTLKGRVTQLSPAIDTDTRTFKGRLEIDNPDRKLRPGMFVKADIVVESKDSVIILPKEILLSRSNGKAVFVVRKETADERIIQTGLENEGMVEVISGIKAGDRVVVKGYETLKNRSKVNVLKK